MIMDIIPLMMINDGMGEFEDDDDELLDEWYDEKDEQQQIIYIGMKMLFGNKRMI